MKLLTFVFILFLSLPAYADNIPLVCEWNLFDSSSFVDKDTFIINLSKNEVYWVNENGTISIKEINNGRIVFEGVPNSRAVENYPNLTFVINRVTGEMSIEGGKFNGVKHGMCRIRESLF